MRELFDYMHMQVQQVRGRKKRYLYRQLPWDSKMFGLVGPRGVGKTTTFLQKVEEINDDGLVLYVTCDHLYFSSHTLYDLADDFYKNGGKWLFIDEVHKYPDWSRQLKLIHDSFGDLHAHFTGSSILDLAQGDTNLSRRAPLHYLQGLSFREFLNLEKGLKVHVFSLDDILGNKAMLEGVEHPLPLFKEYLARGYYPYSGEADFAIRVEQDVLATLESDIPQYANYSVATARKLKKLMLAISQSVPFKPNMTQLARNIGASRNSVQDYLSYMDRAGLISLLKSDSGAFKDIAKVEKIYLDNPSLMSVLGSDNLDIGTLRETFFYNQMRVNHDVAASDVADFRIGESTFEVGGKNKTGRQIKGIDQSFLAKDDIERGYGKEIPLWAFGLNY